MKKTEKLVGTVSKRLKREAAWDGETLLRGHTPGYRKWAKREAARTRRRLMLLRVPSLGTL